MTKSFQFTAFTNIKFQSGAIKLIGEEIRLLGGKKVLLVTDPGVKNCGHLEQVIQCLKKDLLPFAIFDEVEPNPSSQIVEKGLEILKQNDCDLIVALGGGSAMDTAKAIGIRASHPAPLFKYEGVNKLTNPILPLIAIPTTAGTGSEVSGAAVITDKARKYKAAFRSPFLIPKVALLDPELLQTLPPSIIASTGIDAFTHAYESFISSATNPFSQALALDSMRLIKLNLRRLFANPANLEAAELMMAASTMAGIAMYNGRVGMVHAMAHPLGGHFNIPHGIANAILLPHCMEFTRIGVPELFCRIAEVMDENIKGFPLEDGAKKAIAAVRNLLADLRIPKTLKELGVKRESFEAMAQDAITSGIHLTTPRKVNLEDIKEIYEAAY